MHVIYLSCFLVCLFICCSCVCCLLLAASVRLPYHQPEKKDLAAFLARAELRRKQLVNNCSAGIRQPWKRTLQAEPSVSPVLLTIGTSVSTVDHNGLESAPIVVASSHDVKDACNKKNDLSDVEPSDDNSLSYCGKSVLPPAAINSNITSVDSIDALPDLDGATLCSASEALSVDSVEPSSAGSDMKPYSCPSSKRKLLLWPGGAAQKVSALSDSKTDVEIVDSGPSRVEHSVTEEIKTQDSDCDNLPCLHEILLNQCDKKVPKSEELGHLNDNEPTPAVSSGCMKLRRAVDKLTADIPPPHLSGMLGEIVSLEEDMDESQLEDTQSYHAGVEKLMERLLSHSRGSRAARKPKTIEIRYAIFRLIIFQTICYTNLLNCPCLWSTRKVTSR